MNKKLILIVCLALSAMLLTFTSAGIAQGIKERFKERLPEIIKLKAEGIVGENNLGYLEFVTDQKKMPDLVEAENKDRLAVYQAIAEKETTTAEKVGKRRAIQLRDLASPGHWVQDDTGKWYQK